MFLKDTHDSFLESKRDEMINLNVVRLQNWFRMQTSKKKFKYTKTKAIKIQCWYRMKCQKRSYLKMRNGFCRLQATFRSKLLVRKYLFKREMVVQLQSLIRGKIARERFKTEKEASKIVKFEVKHFNVDLRSDLMLELERRKEQLWHQKASDEIRLKRELGSALDAQREAQRLYNTRLRSFKRKIIENPKLVLKNSKSFREKSKLLDLDEDLADTAGPVGNFIAPPEAFQDLENLDSSGGSSYGKFESDHELNASFNTEPDFSEYQFSKFAIAYFQVWTYCYPGF